MGLLSDIRSRSRWGDILEGQPQHIGLAFLLYAGANAMLVDTADAPKLAGLTTTGWAKLSMALALFHQMLVALVFRLQLHRNAMTHLFGASDMKIWAMLFLPLLVARPITVLMTGWADTLPITDQRGWEIATGVALIAAAIYAMHSVLFYFTLPRALGGDHFRDHFAKMELVRQGVFRFTPNAMYWVVFIGLWGIAFLFGSWNALVLALFQHCYIWVHMYCTENPDMEWIYGQR
jgi:hypothetical protein